jgi:hypothetical protein
MIPITLSGTHFESTVIIFALFIFIYYRVSHLLIFLVDILVFLFSSIKFTLSFTMKETS